MLSRILYLALTFLFVSSGGFAGEFFNNPTVGFSIEKPDGWSYLTTQQISESRKNVRMNDEELQEAAQKYAAAPLVAMARYPEPYDDLNSQIHIVFRPLGKLQGTSPTEILKIMVSTFQGLVTDFEFVDNIQETKVSGLEAATMRAKYKMSNQEGRAFNVLSRIIIVPRGAYMFMISTSCKPDDPDNSEAILLSTLDTIKIQK